MTRIAIIGAGPIGLEAALLARRAGFQVAVIEKGRVAENILDWGHVRLFTPFAMNSSEQGREAVAKAFGGVSLPRDDELLTGREFAERYLILLSRVPELAGCIREQCEVLSISRQRFGKTDGIGQRARAADPFQLLLRQTQNIGHDEFMTTADVVLDCSGTYPHHNWIGAGGQRCPLESYLLEEDDYRIVPITPGRFANQTTLVIGAGYSAATAVIELAELAKGHPRTKTIWLTRPLPDGSQREMPIKRIANDPLLERDRIAQRANELVRHGEPSVRWCRNSQIIGLDRQTENEFRITIEQQSSEPTAEQGSESLQRTKLIVNQLIANVGYRPDRSLYEELHIHECYATQGPIKLAAKLLGETSPDCLAQTSHGCDVLKNPEPNFFILGSKSYGRNSNFLLRTGIEQVREAMTLIVSGP